MLIGTYINIGGLWKQVYGNNESISVKVSGLWITVDNLWVRVGGVWKLVYNADIVDLQYAAANETQFGGSSTAWIKVYGSTSRISEQWYLDDTIERKTNNVVVPDANIVDYQMKWDALSGDPPNDNTVAEGVWHPLSSGTFQVAWQQGGIGYRSGAATISIRKGTDPTVLDTAMWEGDAEVEEEK